MRLIDGGRHRIVATHVDNLIHALGLAINHGAGGRGYYVFDDGSTTVRDFLAGLLQAHGLTLPEASICLCIVSADVNARFCRDEGAAQPTA
jgi:nucleoside-diphosphate-sugar epimerase